MLHSTSLELLWWEQLVALPHLPSLELLAQHST